MRKINLYITWRLAFATVFVATTLITAVWLTQSLRFINLVVNKGLSFLTFLHLSSLLLPNLATLVLPAALLVATLLVYNRLITENELVVMRAVGISSRQLLAPALQITAVVMTILYVMNLYFLPWSLRKLRTLEHDLRNQVSISMLKSGQFNNFQDLTIYVKEISPSGELYGVIIHNAQKKESPFTITARKGEIIHGDGKTSLALFEGVRHDEPTQKGASPSSTNFEQYVVNLKEPTIERRKRPRKPYEYSTRELLYPDKSLSKSKYRKFISQGHQRILGPLHTVAFVLIALAILLMGGFSRRSRSKRNIVIVTLCVAVQISNLAFINLAEKMPVMILIAYLFLLTIIVVFLLIFYEKINFDAVFEDVLS